MNVTVEIGVMLQNYIKVDCFFALQKEKTWD